MSKLNIDQKSVRALFSEKKADFLIPDYQRPYAWGEKECQTLWDDLFLFAFPDNDCDKFNSDSDEYFLGPIVTFKNDDGKMEIIDGQQRLTTLMLLLRAFYEKYGSMKNDKAVKTSKFIEQCIWKTDEFGDPDKSALKIDSEVATDKEKDEFLNILKTGTLSDCEKSSYANNYRFFQQKIVDFLNTYPDWFSFFPIRIMNNCILLPIEAESQDTALRIFSTLNDRGKPLSDADIFKAQFYKYYSAKGEREVFIQKWKDLEVLCDSIFHPITGTPMDELFTRYMYYERAKQGIKSSTTEALRKFYERNAYSLLKNDQTFENLINLADFWNDVQNQNVERFSDRVLRKYLMDIIVDCPHEIPIYTFTGNYLVIRTSDQSLASLRCDEYMYRLDEAEYKKRTRRLTLDKDDIVYGREGSWGLACLVPQSNKYCLGQRVMQFRCNTRLLYPKYAMYALNSETVYMQGALDTIGSTAPHVNISTICNYLLPVPALTEQKEITNYLDAKCAEIDMLIAKKEQLVKELESYKKSLIYEVVTGKREV